MATTEDEVIDVVVIGGGWSGLMACKYAKEEGLSVRVLEKRDDIGKVFDHLATYKRMRSPSSSLMDIA